MGYEARELGYKDRERLGKHYTPFVGRVTFIYIANVVCYTRYNTCNVSIAKHL
jgi:hypothetical protein